MDKHNIETIFALSQLQKAFLFHGLDDDHDDPGQLQMLIELTGDLDKSAFEEAWQWLLQRHMVLRTSIHWKNLEKPLQVVHRQCQFAVRFESSLDIKSFSLKDRNKHFDLSQAPIQRVTMISSDAMHHTLCWSCHHILLDGWSVAVALQQLMGKYAEITDHVDYRPPLAVPYQVWLKHITASDAASSKKFWQQELNEVCADTRFWPVSAGSSVFNSVMLQLDLQLTDQITRRTRTLQSTTGQLMQTVWALTLAQLKQLDEVIFGITVSGRSAGPAGVENMLGLLVNSLPLRVKLIPELTFSELLQTLHKTSRDRAEHEHISLADLHRWNCISGQHAFDTLLVVENFPWINQQDGSLKITEFRGDFTAHYPFTLVIIPGDRMQLKLYYNENLTDRSRAKQLLTLIQNILLSIVESTEITVAQLRQSHALQPQEQLLLPAIQPPTVKTQKSKPDEDTPIRKTLLQIWQDVLNIQGISIHDNFFDLGGNSFIGLILIDRINQITGKQLPLISLFQAPTIAGFITLLEQEFNLLPGTRLIPIRQSGNRIPFFFVHGGTWITSILANQLDAQQPFFLLNAHWDDGKIGLDETIEGLASAYIEDMRRIQEKGPWRIGGYSMGTVIIYEMAQQLTRQGEQIDFLFLLDPTTNARIFKNIDGFIEKTSQINSTGVSQQSLPVLSNFTDRIVRKRQLISDNKSTYLHEANKHVKYLIKKTYRKLITLSQAQLIKPAKRAIAHHYFIRGKTIPISLRELYVANAYAKICKRYQPQQYMGSLLIFTGEKYPQQSFWDYLATQKNCKVTFNCKHLEFIYTPEVIHRWTTEFAKYIE